MRCRTCRASVELNWMFCPWCGMKLETGKENRIFQKAVTFGELYEKWMESYRSRIGSSTRYCYQAARKYFSALEEKTFYMIDLEDLQNCVDDCPKGIRTKENMKALACLMYRYALPRHMTDQNYAIYLDTGQGKKTPREPFSAQEIQILMEHIGRVDYVDEIIVLIYTGFRPCELMELKKEQYVRKENVHYLIGGRKTKAGINRLVTLSPKIVSLIENRVNSDSEYLFPRCDGKKMSVAHFRNKHFYPALDAIGLQSLPERGSHPRLTPYSCRHTFSDLIKNVPGADRDKAALMGHASYQTTKAMYQSSCVLDCKEITDRL